jgi:hypothetical protein
MNHIFLQLKNFRPALCRAEILDGLLAGVLTGLVCHAAGGLARGLAGSLAFAAAACFDAPVQIAGLKGFNAFHKNILLSCRRGSDCGGTSKVP